MTPFGGEPWSNGHQLLGKSTAPGDSADIEFAAPDAVPRKLVLYATQATDYAKLRFQVNGQDVASTFDGYAPGEQTAPPFMLGTFEPRNGKYRFRINVAGANPAARGAKYFWGLDCVILEKP